MLLPKPIQRTAALPYVFIIVGIVLVGIVTSLFVFFRVDTEAKTHLIDRAATIARMIPVEDLVTLEGTSSDETSPTYQGLKTLLTEVRAVNRDVRFIYLVGKMEDGRLFFYLDSEDPASPDVSPPGQIYDEAPPPMYAVLLDGKSRSDSYADRWGSWVSGYASVHADDGHIVALLGIDTPSKEHYVQAFSYALLPFLLSLFLASIGGVALYIRTRELHYITQKAEFLSIASHEIRTPLTGMRWALASLLDHESGINLKDLDALKEVHAICSKLISRINSLLNNSALEAGKKVVLQKKEVLVKKFITEMCEDLSLAARQKNVQLVIDPSITDALIIVCDPEYMRQVFFNLLSNGIKYTKQNTSVTISYIRHDHEHQFRVSDEGDGIKAEDVEKIFHGYHRTIDALKSGEYGTGIGLYLTLQILKLHDGGISVEPNTGRGMSFIVTLPR